MYISPEGMVLNFHSIVLLHCVSVCIKTVFWKLVSQEKKMLEQKILLWLFRLRNLCLTPKESYFQHSIQRVILHCIPLILFLRLIRLLIYNHKYKMSIIDDFCLRHVIIWNDIYSLFSSSKENIYYSEERLCSFNWISFRICKKLFCFLNE